MHLNGFNVGKLEKSFDHFCYLQNLRINFVNFYALSYDGCSIFGSVYGDQYTVEMVIYANKRISLDGFDRFTKECRSHFFYKIEIRYFIHYFYFPHKYSYFDGFLMTE